MWTPQVQFGPGVSGPGICYWIYMTVVVLGLCTVQTHCTFVMKAAKSVQS